MNITISLTEEQVAVLMSERHHPMVRHLLRRSGQIGNLTVMPTTPEEFVQSIITGIADEGLRRTGIMRSREVKELKVKE